jgi:hypothetical protein
VTFYGKENEPKAVAVDTPLRTYAYLDYGSRQHTIEAHYVTFTSGHVNFWRRRADQEQDTLVKSEANTHVNSLQAVTR